MQKFIALFFAFLGVLYPLYSQPTKTVLLGFDGLDPALVRKWIKENKLPNMAKLAKQGTLTELATTNPAQSPVAWATFATGNNPGKHQITGFLKRGQGKYLPEFALARVDKRSTLPHKSIIFLSAGILGFLTCLIFAVLIFKEKRISWKSLSALLIFLATIFANHILTNWIPEKVPYPVSMKKGESFWSIVAKKGIKTQVLMAPIAFPAEKVPGGKLLCGFGVPDIKGTNGLWSLYSTRFNEAISTETGGWKLPLAIKENKLEGTILGPRNIVLEEQYNRYKNQLLHASFAKTQKIKNRMGKIRSQLQLVQKFTVLPQKKAVEIRIAKQKQVVAKGKWSDWFRLTFRMNPLLTISGMCRFRVVEVSKENVELYLTPLQFHPCHLPANITLSYPKKFACKLAKEVGIYPTLGWAAATNPLKDETISEEVFWEDLQLNLQARHKLLKFALEQNDWQLLVSVFYFPDRAAHMYWRYIDSQNPRHKKDSSDYPDFTKKLLSVYQKADEIIGEVLHKLKKEKNSILLVCSDHGFAPFRWEVNLNTWLLEEGYLKLKHKNPERKQVRELFEKNDILSHIDWPQTKAYSIGLGKIFINLEGRDPEGIVPKSQYKALQREISEKLASLKHNGNKVAHKVYLRQDIFFGPYVKEIADILPGFSWGYRVSWQSCLGGVPPKVIEPNLLKWSGDHCSVDPSLVPGVFISNCKISSKKPSLQDIAPSILKLYGTAESMDGKVFDIFYKK